MSKQRHSSRNIGLFTTLFVLVAACGSSGDGETSLDPSKGSTPDGGSGNGDDGGELPLPTDDDAGPREARDPTTCAEALQTHSYVGCDYWPTITPNGPNSKSFHFAAVVANTGMTDATVTVTGPNSVDIKETVPPGGLATIKLPWVPELKGPDMAGWSVTRPKGALVPNGAYHLVSTSPIIVYQFNALEFQAGGSYSYSNDASLLLPSTAMRNTYRVTGIHGWKLNGSDPISPVLSITATQDNTQVKLKLAPTAPIEAAGSIAAAAGGSTVTFTLAKAGDVASIVGQGDRQTDFSGSIVQSSAPVQVISSVPCMYLPDDVAAADHVEETVMPAEAFGKKYVVAPPTGAGPEKGEQVVRLFGNQDGTKLTYSPQKPSGCPDTLNAGQAADCGIVKDAFVVEGDKEFAVQSYLLGSQYYPSQAGLTSAHLGDPSATNHPAVEQYRKNYIFLAPTDYPVLWADVVAPQGTTVRLDGADVTATAEAVGNSGYGVYRLDLKKSGKDGVHSLSATQPVAVQVIGYGTNTTFQYPAGLNLSIIAPLPPVK